MKRFEGFDYIILYHGTSSVFREEIETKGLLPRTKTDISNFKDGKKSLPNSIYLGHLDNFGNIFDNVKTHAFKSIEKWGAIQ